MDSLITNNHVKLVLKTVLNVKTQNLNVQNVLPETLKLFKYLIVPVNLGINSILTKLNVLNPLLLVTKLNTILYILLLVL